MGLKAKFWDCVCGFFLSRCMGKPIRFLFGSNPKVSHPKVGVQYVHTPGTFGVLILGTQKQDLGELKPFLHFWPNLTMYLLKKKPECAWCVHIPHPYFGARYYGVRPKKKPYWFDHAPTQKKVAHTIPKFTCVAQFPLGFLKGSFLRHFPPIDRVTNFWESISPRP